MENKYIRKIVGLDGTVVEVDVYRVLDAFEVANPQMQHLIKKALATGIRGHKDMETDLNDIIASAKSALKMYEQTGRLTTLVRPAPQPPTIAAPTLNR